MNTECELMACTHLCELTISSRPVVLKEELGSSLSPLEIVWIIVCFYLRTTRCDCLLQLERMMSMFSFNLYC